MPALYEWTVETVDEYGDIQECVFYDKLNEVQALEDNERIGLVRYAGNEDDGESDRQYAYFTDTHDEYTEIDHFVFDGGAKVPKRFRDQFEKWHG